MNNCDICGYEDVDEYLYYCDKCGRVSCNDCLKQNKLKTPNKDGCPLCLRTYISDKELLEFVLGQLGKSREQVTKELQLVEGI